MLAQRKTLSSEINYEMCKKCGGRCCKSSPCQYLPIDFDSIEGIEDEIESNHAIIDIGECDGEEVFFLRIRNWKEDLTSPHLLLPPDHIYLANEETSGDDCCMYYKLQDKYYLGIKYDEWNEERIRALTKRELRELFSLKIERDRRNLKFQSMEKNIQDYLEAKAEHGWGGCLLSEDKRPGGALYIVPDYRNGKIYCKKPEEMFKDNWDQPEHQEKLIKILSKRGLLKK